jgi:hypothetical protein
MKKDYDFSKAKRGAVIPQRGKTRITIYLDDEIIDEFRESICRSPPNQSTRILSGRSYVKSYSRHLDAGNLSAA